MNDLKNLLKKILLASIFISGSLHASVVSIKSSDQIILPGDVFSLTVSGSDFTTPLDAGGINISFEGAIIQAAPLAELPNGVTAQVVLDPLWDVDSPRAPVINDNSIEDIFFFTSGFDAVGNFDIATIWFKAVNEGTSPIEFAESQLNPFAGGGSALAVDLINSTVEVQVIPVPAAVWFMASGLLGLVSIRRISGQ